MPNKPDAGGGKLPRLIRGRSSTRTTFYLQFTPS
jgi:hypothetical protein